MNVNILRKTSLIAAAITLVAANMLYCQEAKLSPIVPDPNILKRTPIIDGTVSAGEWDGFQSFTQADWQVATYANWDSKNLYYAITSNKPIDAMILLDANDDGWFHGEDNYEIRAIRQADASLAKQVLKYESRNVSTIAPLPVSDSELAQVVMKTSVVDGVTNIEISVPIYLLRDIKMFDGKKIGVQIAVRQQADDNSWIPNAVSAERKECVKSTLVTKKWSALSPITLNFGVKDPRVARGEDLAAVLQISNTDTQTADVRTITISGNGPSASYLDSVQRRVEGVPAGKTVREEMRSNVPKNMPLGTWVIGTEIRSNDQKLGAGLASFDVLEPYDAELRLPKGDVNSDAKDVNITVIVRNNTRRSLWGNAKVTLPLGWEFSKGINQREYTIHTRDSETAVVFKARPPIGALGDIPVSVSVSGGNVETTLEGSFRVVTPK